MALSIVGNGSVVEHMDAGKDFNECRLARAVFAQQNEDLASPNRQADFAEGLRAPEPLGDVAHVKHNMRPFWRHCIAIDVPSRRPPIVFLVLAPRVDWLEEYCQSASECCLTDFHE
jgi:hypothetical protein